MIDLPPNFPEFEWPLHEMLFYRSLGSGGKYLICARGPGDGMWKFGNEIAWTAEYDTCIEANNHLDGIARLQALQKALLR